MAESSRFFPDPTGIFNLHAESESHTKSVHTVDPMVAEIASKNTSKLALSTSKVVFECALANKDHMPKEARTFKLLELSESVQGKNVPLVHSCSGRYRKALLVNFHWMGPSMQP